jgi:hypothetical protein
MHGETSSGVAAVQAGLIDLGYIMPKSLAQIKGPDGVFGDETKIALIRKQSLNIGVSRSVKDTVRVYIFWYQL